MDFPKISIGQYAVLQAELATGVVLKLDGERHLGLGEGWLVFDSLEEAVVSSNQKILDFPEIECNIFNHLREHIFTASRLKTDASSDFSLKLNKPPSEIDGAKVLYWAWSSSTPFGIVYGIPDEIYGLAICQYRDSNEFYRFSCNKNWETQQDGLYDSVEQAMEYLPAQYRNVKAVWIKFE
jgi:hypothetical protein